MGEEFTISEEEESKLTKSEYCKCFGFLIDFLFLRATDNKDDSCIVIIFPLALILYFPTVISSLPTILALSFHSLSFVHSFVLQIFPLTTHILFSPRPQT